MSDLLELFRTAVHHAQIVNYVALGTGVLWFYDYLLNLPREIDYIWLSKMSKVKLFYLLSRVWAPLHLIISMYYVLKFDHSAAACKRFIIVTSTTGNLNGMLAELMVYLHIYAFSHKSPFVGWFLVFQYITLFTACSVFLGLLCAKMIYVQPAMPWIGCVPVADPKVDELSGYVFIAPLIAHVTIILVALVVVVQKYRGLRSKIVDAFMRDGLAYPVGKMLLALANIVLAYTAPNTPIKKVLMLPVSVFHNIITARLILHLREEHYKSVETATSGKNMTTIKFASHRAPQKKSFFTSLPWSLSDSEMDSSEGGISSDGSQGRIVL